MLTQVDGCLACLSGQSKTDAWHCRLAGSKVFYHDKLSFVGTDMYTAKYCVYE